MHPTPLAVLPILHSLDVARRVNLWLLLMIRHRLSFSLPLLLPEPLPGL